MFERLYPNHEGRYVVAIETLFMEGAADYLVTLPDTVTVKNGFTPADQWAHFVDPIVRDLYTQGDPTAPVPEMVTHGLAASWLVKDKEVFAASLTPVLDLNDHRPSRAATTVADLMGMLSTFPEDEPIYVRNLASNESHPIVDVAPYDGDEERNPYWTLAVEFDSDSEK